MFSSLNFSIPGFSIAAKAWGNPNHPLILALHGWLDNANSFDGLAPLLANQYYVIAIDLPGHGLSSHLHCGSHYHFIDGIFNISQLIPTFNRGPIHVLAHSLGACLASLLAGIAPEQVQSLVLIEAIGPFSSPETTCRDQLIRYRQQVIPYKRKAYESLDACATARSKRGHIHWDLARILSERGVCEDNGHFYWRHDRRLLLPSPLHLTEEQVLSCLQGIEAPTYLIWGEQGFRFDPPLLAKRTAAIKNLQTEYLPGGHHLHMEYPDVLFTHLDVFYRNL